MTSSHDEDSKYTETIIKLRLSIHDTLMNSNSLNPVYTDVKDQSFWYHMRHRLGVRKQTSIIIEQNNTSGRWESYVYKLRPRDKLLLWL